MAETKPIIHKNTSTSNSEVSGDKEIPPGMHCTLPHVEHMPNPIKLENLQSLVAYQKKEIDELKYTVNDLIADRVDMVEKLNHMIDLYSVIKFMYEEITVDNKPEALT